MNYQALEMVKRHKGFKSKPHRCTTGKLTIGYGRDLDDLGITRSEASLLLAGDIVEAEQDARAIFLDFHNFAGNRQAALIDMIFNLGRTRFVKFKRMVKAINRNDWELAAVEALGIKWAGQVGDHAGEIAEMLRHG